MNDNTRIVALNARFTGTQQPTGTQIASFHLFDAILRSERQVRAVVFADRRFAGVEAWASLAGTEIVDIPFGSWKRSVAQIWEQVSLPRAARRRGCRLIHHPMTTGSLLKLGLASIVTVHDLNFYHHGEWISRAFRWWLCRVIVPVIKRADRVVAISDYVLDDVRRTLHISESRSLRIYNGLRSLSTELVRSETAAEIPNILGVNLWQPHKNLPRLINAFKRVKQVHPNLELHLAGRPQGTFRSQPELAAMI